ncbi:hypothetical protein WMY93_016139 [Mugilogobius chulae]|uniref:Uncharacterized protein n=1 Tax=Mugilogobius chulae TaxID=88201 RepID=A0AAW0NT17_9GOBI
MAMTCVLHVWASTIFGMAWLRRLHELFHYACRSAHGPPGYVRGAWGAASDTQPNQSSGGQCRGTKRPSSDGAQPAPRDNHISVSPGWGPQPGRRAAAGPPACEDDAISVAASDTQFHDTDAVNEPLDGYSEASEFSSHSDCSHGGEEDSAAASLRVALARLSSGIPDCASRRSAAIKCEVPKPTMSCNDELLCKAYDAGARMGRMGNSLSHLLLGLASSLEAVGIDTPTQGLVDTSLQTFALMSRELGRLLSTLTQVRRQVWLAQSPLTETCRRTLRALPVVPGELFGAAAQEALQRTALASQTRQQLAGLHRRATSLPSPGPVPSSRQPIAGSFQVPQRPVTRASRFRNDRPRMQSSSTSRLLTVPSQLGLIASLPGHPRAGEVADEEFRPAVGYFSPEQLRHWVATTQMPGY